MREAGSSRGQAVTDPDRAISYLSLTNNVAGRVVRTAYCYALRPPGEQQRKQEMEGKTSERTVPGILSFEDGSLL